MKIKTLVLATNDVKAVSTFYKDLLGLKVMSRSDEKISFAVGSSTLTFKKVETETAPTYHFAFNIPENQKIAAKDWLKEQLELVSDYENNEIVDFPNWNAHALYFMDSVGNIVEFIARHDLENASNQPFSAESILDISEIGLPVADVNDFKEKLQEQFDLPVYKAASARFAPMGDTEGLFICVPLGRVWFPTEDLKSAMFPTVVEIEAPKKGKLVYGKYEINAI